MVANHTSIDDRRRRSSARDGQVLVIFALSLVALAGMVGLVLDGGSTFAQRRDQQNATDLASLAAANDYLLTNDAVTAEQRARDVAAANGFAHGVGGVVVSMTLDTSMGATIVVDIDAPHHNNFASVMGFASWQVSTTATALAGFPDTASGAAAFIFSIGVFGTDGTPRPEYSDPSTPYAFGETNGDVPEGSADFAWTNYGTGNVSTPDVEKIITGETVINKAITFGEYIGQENSGFHGPLFDLVATELAGRDMVTPIVDANGNFQGWATFHIVTASGGSDKTITGYFVDNYTNPQLTISACSALNCPRYLGSYVLELID